MFTKKTFKAKVKIEDTEEGEIRNPAYFSITLTIDDTATENERENYNKTYDNLKNIILDFVKDIKIHSETTVNAIDEYDI